MLAVHTRSPCFEDPCNRQAITRSSCRPKTGEVGLLFGELLAAEVTALAGIAPRR